MASARAKAELADEAARKAKEHCDLGRIKAKEVAPDFHQPGESPEKGSQWEGRATSYGCHAAQECVGSYTFDTCLLQGRT